MNNKNFSNFNISGRLWRIMLVIGMGIYLSAFTTTLIPKERSFKPGEAGPTDWADYKSWDKITKVPNTGDPTGFLDKKHMGTSAFRDIYVNKSGIATNRGDADFPYPEGTIIVKEAFKNEKAYKEKKKPELTIMIKLEKGSAPDTNDWEFVMGGDGKNRGSGMDSKWGKFCGSCHINAVATDYTFMTSKFLK